MAQHGQPVHQWYMAPLARVPLAQLVPRESWAALEPLVRLELEQLEPLVPLDLWAALEQLVPLDLWAALEQLEQLVPLDLWAALEQLEQLEQLVRLEPLEPLEQLEQLVLLDPQVLVAVPLEQPAYRILLDIHLTFTYKYLHPGRIYQWP